mgnify:CR=1 FL=1
MGRGKNKNKNKKKAKPRKLTGREKAQQMAKRNIAKYGGTASAAAANKASNQAKAKTKSIAKGTTGIGPVKSGSAYSKAVSTAKNQPTKKTSGIGPYASAAKYEAALKASPPVDRSGTLIASHDKPLFKSVPATGPAADVLAGPEFKRMYLDGGLIKGGDSGIGGRANPMGIGTDLVSNKLTGLGIGDARATTGFTPSIPGLAESLGIDSKTGLDSEGRGPSYLSTKSAESFGAPSQAETDAAAGITAGGLNIGGSGFTPTNQSGGSTSRAISDRPASSFNFGPTIDRFGRGDEYAKNINEFQMRFGATPEARADAYDRSLTGRKNLFDNATDESGPVASGDAYARGLEVSRFGSPMNIGKTILNTIPGVNFRLQNDKSLADSVGRAPTLKRRGGGGGGARLPVAPLTPEEILLPEEVAAPVYQQVAGQTGVDPNRLMQIQQDAYLQAFNPSYNPMFRFFNRGMRRGAFRKAFRRD